MRKQVLVSVDRGETRVAILECKKAAGGKDEKSGGRRARPRSTRTGAWRSSTSSAAAAGRSSGNVYKGRVDNVLAGMEAAFVDIGLEKNGFLHVDEIVTPGRQDPAPRTGARWAAHLRPAEGGSGDRRAGDQGPDRHEGRPPLHGGLDPGRYLVYAPDGDGVGVSRKLPDKERERLRKLAAGLKLDRAA